MTEHYGFYIAAFLLITLTALSVLWAINKTRQYLALKEELKKNISDRKSDEVRLGQIAEQIAPFLDKINYNPKSMRFLGSPIDFVVFDTEKIVFIEVKTGNSRLTPKQRDIRKLIQDKKVEFEEVRIS